MQEPPREKSFSPKSPMHWHPQCSLIPSTFPTYELCGALPGHHCTALSPGSVWPRGISRRPRSPSRWPETLRPPSALPWGQSKLVISHLSWFGVFQSLSAVVWELKRAGIVVSGPGGTRSISEAAMPAAALPGYPSGSPELSRPRRVEAAPEDRVWEATRSLCQRGPKGDTTHAHK